MPEFDVAIVGTRLLSGLLAGVLARDHGKKVVRVGRPLSAQRLPRNLNLALPFAVRPETWRMLRRAEADTRVLLGSLGLPDSVTTTEAELVADQPHTAMALDHLAHMALGYGHQVRRTETGWAFRRVGAIDRESVEKRLPDWLRAAGVTSIADGTVDTALTILADEDALHDNLADNARPAPLISRPMTSTLLMTRTPLPPIRRFTDRGVTLQARADGAVLSIVSGEHDVDARLASTLPGPFPIRRLAATHYRGFATSDGAPLIGMSGQHFIIAGLANVAPFFAPALARLIAGTVDDFEGSWFEAHRPGGDRTRVAEASA